MRLIVRPTNQFSVVVDPLEQEARKTFRSVSLISRGLDVDRAATALPREHIAEPLKL